MSGRVFKITLSERRYRFQPEALRDHAPRRPGVYLLLAGDGGSPKVLYVGAAIPGRGESVYAALAGHLMGNLRPNKTDLLKHARDLYFEFLADADVSAPEDYLDIAGALAARTPPCIKPPGKGLASGRYDSVSLEVS
jgi:hypothetical protein